MTGFIALIVVLFSWSNAQAYSYRAACSNTLSPISVTATVISAFGAPGLAVDISTTEVFQGGVLIQECSGAPIDNDDAYTILSGVRQNPTGCGDSHCVRIYNSATNTWFDYGNIIPDSNLPPIGSSTVIASGTLVGQIQVDMHLRLQEVKNLAGTNYKLNPQRPNALDFFQNKGTGPVFSTASISGATNQSLILLPKSQYYPEGLQTNPAAFRNLNDIYYVKGAASVLITARGNSYPSMTGMYSTGFTLEPPGKKVFSFNTPFMMLPDVLTTNLNDYRTIYLSSSSTGITYLSQNKKLNGIPAIETISDSWDTTDRGSFPDGSRVEVCGFVKDYPQGHINSSACTTAVVDNSPPVIPTLSAGGATFTVATSTPIVTAQGTDSDGIYSIRLTGVSYSSTNYVSGFQTLASNQFPDSGNLAIGSYTATVTDLAGNSARASFIIGRDQFLVEGRA